MTQRFANRRIAVTGAAGGIGLAVVRALADEGAQVYALDVRAASTVPKNVTFYECDLASQGSITSLVSRLYAHEDAPVDLVNCAGIVEDNVAAEDMTIAEFDRVLTVNLRGVFITCQAFGRELLARGGGVIVNIASMSGNAIVNYPQKQSAYNTSKSGVSALTRSLAVEWSPRGVRLNALSPGYVDTPLNALKPDMHEQWKDGSVIHRFATPEEVAASVSFLLSDEAAYYTGAELLMDGGYSLR